MHQFNSIPVTPPATTKTKGQKSEFSPTGALYNVALIRESVGGGVRPHEDTQVHMILYSLALYLTIL